MKMLNIECKNGKIKKTKNIKLIQDGWYFLNDDPQILIKFNNPIKHLTIKIRFSNYVDERINAKIYFDKQKKLFHSSYSEENTKNFKIDLRGNFVKNIHFDKPQKEVRLDLSETSGTIPIESILIDDSTKSYLSKNKIAIVTHDLSNTGAPLLAYNVAKKLKENNCDVVVLFQSDYSYNLYEKYVNNNIDIYFLDQDEWNGEKVDSDNYLDNLLIYLKENGFSKIITNTVVSGKYADIYNKHGFKIISLIHEMGNTIEENDWNLFATNIANYSDGIVFPDKCVKDSFLNIVKSIQGNVYIHPQGIYLKKEVFNNCCNCRNVDYVLGSGTIEKRKGFDLFIEIAEKVSRVNPNIKFVWTGNWSNSSFKKEMEEKINQMNLKDVITINPFIDDAKKYQTILRGAKCFCLTSREDPFPSVVLEAMSFHIPTIGFSDSGGYVTMSMKNKGVAVRSFDVDVYAHKIIEILDEKIKLDDNEIENFIKTLSFDDYANWLLLTINNIK